MRTVPPIASDIADELHRTAAALRGGALSLEKLPRAIHEILKLLVPESDEAAPPIQTDGSPTTAAELVQALQQFTEHMRSQTPVLDLEQEPLLELIDEGSTGESAHSAVELFGLHTSQTDGTGSIHDQTHSRDKEACVSLDPPALDPLLAGRYEVRGALGTGGQGDVIELYDQHLQRTVALKVLRDEYAQQEHTRRAFMREATLTAQLSHPGIIPILDMGEVASGAPCYTMKRIKGRSLRQILREQRREGGKPLEFSRRRLLEILIQVAHAVGYAHHNGVVHRDLKPANIMVGSYGEVLVLDWGIARVMGELTPMPGQDRVDPGRYVESTDSGMIKGTPAYMAPEQAKAQTQLIGPRTDVHALGLVLYEILIGRPARDPGHADEVINEARSPIEVGPEQRRRTELVRTEPIPEELDQICRRCILEDPNERYPDGEALARALQGYLAGQKRRELAEKQAEEADQLYQKYEALEAHLRDLADRVASERDRVDPWAVLEEKRPLWELEQQVHETERERDEVVDQAINAYTQSLDGDGDNIRARSGLAQLYYDKLLKAERFGRMRDARQLEAQVRRLDDGAFATKLDGHGELSLASSPENAEVWLYQYETVDRALMPTRGQPLGRTPKVVEALPVGRYLLVLRIRGGREIHHPILIRRHEKLEAMIHLYHGLDDRFVLVPGGMAILGGDRNAPGAAKRTEEWVEDFAMARLPITCKEYLRFLSSLPMDEAILRVPRAARVHGGRLWWPVNGGRISIPRVDDSGGRWDPRYPVRAVSRLDAERYATWRSKVEELPLRLPTEKQWERAGRGADGRVFPWGDSFDATFCKMRDSRPGRPEPEPAGAFVTDRSPYGIQDLAGSASEWVAGPFDRYQILGSIKGGYWKGGAVTCRLARRFAADPDEPAPFTGFRLMLDLREWDARERTV